MCSALFLLDSTTTSGSSFTLTPDGGAPAASPAKLASATTAAVMICRMR
ncbi:MAG: hypothetical protein J6L79_05290 [Muribaculaceae bacterium]|nr:hypothetical protein [Muribaculaceae bacterium]